ncbi:MAG: SDR family NAD(P)-dependent oxidoreductase [Candidatus Limnocylindrales bacterium]
MTAEGIIPFPHSERATAGRGRLAGKVSIITGAGQNIGRAMAELFASEGSAVAVVDLSAERAARVVDAIGNAGGRAAAYDVDVTDEAAVERLVASVVEAFGGVQVLVNNVAATVNASLVDCTLEQWEMVHAVTLRSTFFCAKHAARQMIAQGRGGSIVNLGSTSGQRGIRGKFPYAVAKAGVYNLTRAAAMELAEHGIRVNTLTPTQTGSPVGVADEDFAATVRAHEPKGIPLGRWGRPIDQANAAMFLASDESAFITGADLPCDGGLLAVFPRAY